MKKQILFAMLFLAGGAAMPACTSTEVVTGPDGSRNPLISCMDIAQCYSEARKQCGGNYEIVNTSSSVDATSVNGPSTTQSLLVKCQKQPQPN